MKTFSYNSETKGFSHAEDKEMIERNKKLELELEQVEKKLESHLKSIKQIIGPFIRSHSYDKWIIPESYLKLDKIVRLREFLTQKIKK